MGLLGGGASSTSVSSSDEAKPMTVYVTVGDKNLSCEVRRGDTVSNLKSAIHQQAPDMHVNKMHFSYKETEMKDSEKLSEYGIKNRSRVMATGGGGGGGHGGHGHEGHGHKH